MRFATAQTKINAPFFVKQAGHIIQVDKLKEYHDDLYARLLYLEDEAAAWLHISADNLGMDLKIQKTIEEKMGVFWQKKLHVTLSCTHAHHCCDPEDERYLTFFLETVIKAAQQLDIKEAGELQVNYRTAYFDQLGKSRISHHEADSLHVDLIQILKEDQVLAEIVIHNVHPTILYAKHPFFSAEYPGYVLQRLQEIEPDVFHTFMQGAAGDTSTRFTRKSQDYDSVIWLGDKLLVKLEDMKKITVQSVPLRLTYTEQSLPLFHEFHPIDMSKMPQDLSERELITIGYGQILREQLKEQPEKIKKEALLSCMDLGGPRIIFAPNEMFSWWRTQVDDSFCALVCYSNGEAPYMTGPGQYLLTYETFTDTVTDESKQRIAELFRKWGYKQ